MARVAGAHPGLPDEITALSGRLQAHPEAAGFLRRAELERLAGDLDAAALDLERAARIGPAVSGLDLCRAALALDRGRDSDALASLTRHLAAHPDDPLGLRLRARIEASQGDRLAAARDLGLAIRRLPAPEPARHVAPPRLLRAPGPDHVVAAEATLDEGIARLGSIPSLELERVDLAEARGDFSSALARLDGMAERLERPGAWLTRRAELLERSGDA